MSEPQGRIGCNASFAQNNFIDASGWHINILSQSILIESKKLNKFFKKNFSGMHGRMVDACYFS